MAETAKRGRPAVDTAGENRSGDICFYRGRCLMEQSRNHTEFLRLYNMYYKAVYYTSLGLLHQPDAAADCMQDTFAALWESFHKGEEIGNPGAWLMTVARHVSLSFLRRQRRLSPLEDIGELPSPEDETSRLPEEELFISRLLAPLPEPEREIVVLHVLGGLRLAEIARTMDVPSATVRWRFANARKLLKKELDRAARSEQTQAAP